MIDYISNSSNDVLTNTAVNNKANLKLVDNNSSSKNPYAKGSNDIIDESSISTQAENLYKQEQEYGKYKQMVMEGLQNNVSPSQLVSMINNNSYLSNDELAGTLLNNSSFVNMLYNH